MRYSKKARKYIALVLIVVLASQILLPNIAMALTTGPSQPEVLSFEPVGTTDMVDMFSGDFTYNIPLMDVEGYPVNISYHGGVTMEQEASWVGLGWNINPGVINRNVRGIPDDFNGDVLSKELHIKGETNLRVGLGGGAEIIGWGDPDGVGGGISLNASENLNFNNYKGVSCDFSRGLSAGIHINKTASLGVNIGVGVGSQTGASIDYGADLSFATSKEISQDQALGVGVNISGGYNTRSAIQDMNFGISVSVSERDQRNKAKGKEVWVGSSINISGTIPISLKNYVPVITNSSTLNSIFGRIKIGIEEMYVYGYGNINGMYSVLNYNNDGSRPSYGYLYMQNETIDNKAILDFTRDKDGIFNKTMQYLPCANMTYDIYSICGQGTGGMFRPFRNDFGSVYDPYTTSKQSKNSIEIEGGLDPNLFEIGADFTHSGTELTSEPWKDYKRNFVPRKNGSIYEDVYFKQAGELTSVDPSYFAAIGGKNAITPDEAGGLPATKPTALSQRDPRGNLIYYFTASEASIPGVGTNPNIISYMDDNFTGGATPTVDSISRIGSSPLGHKKDEISEIVHFTLTLQKVSDTTKIVAEGMTDFSIGRNIELDNVLLGNPITGTVGNAPIDTFNNCERQLLNTAIRQGVTDYNNYIDSAIAAIRANFVSYLMDSVKEQLILSYINDEFGYTLYNYDRAGNLMTTVPPMGVTPLPVTSLPAIDAARAADEDTIPDYTKINIYNYNTLNEVTTQSTINGGTTRFFYDAAGRLVFSQNAKQAPNGFYTYNLYDKQNRIIETGESQFGCRYFDEYIAGLGRIPLPTCYNSYNIPFTGCMTGLQTVGVGGTTTSGTGGLSTTPWATISNVTLGVNPGGAILGSIGGTTITGLGTGITTGGTTITPGGTLISPNPIFIEFSGFIPYDSIAAAIRAFDRKDVVMTIYDTAAINLQTISGFNTQQNLRKRVAVVKYFDSLLVTDSAFAQYVYATHYSYDMDGNVQTLVQDFPVLAGVRQRYKRIDYDYDLISGKVNMLSYNRGNADQYYQQYAYDADNRITQVQTSNDGNIWKQDAAYTYYEHGPLARIDVGDLRVQGIDYAYTLQGWLKVMNSDTLNASFDMGQDGTSGGPINAPDAAAYTIDYFRNDYKPITAWQMQHTPADSLSLFNGNISRQTMVIDSFQRLNKQYIYDQFNRLKYANYFAISAVDNTLTGLSDFQNNYNYDMDGNILNLVRYGNNTGSGAMLMDSLAYSYIHTDGRTDMLQNVFDCSPDNYTNDIRMYCPLLLAPLQYTYDRIGNTAMDLVSGQDTIEWNLYNKVIKTVNNTDTSSMNFTYDGAGNRVAKAYIKGQKERDDYYVHDAQGNILAIYHATKAFDTTGALTQQNYYLSEHDIYGSSRLGVKDYFASQISATWNYTDSTLDTSRLLVTLPWYSLEYQDLIRPDSLLPYGNVFTDSGYAQHVTGQKQYELTDHLGDVLATVSDQRAGYTFTPISGSLTVDSPANINIYQSIVVSAHDYYPFGEYMPGRYMTDTNSQCLTGTLTESFTILDTFVNSYTTVDTTIVTDTTMHIDTIIHIDTSSYVSYYNCAAWFGDYSPYDTSLTLAGYWETTSSTSTSVSFYPGTGSYSDVFFSYAENCFIPGITNTIIFVGTINSPYYFVITVGASSTVWATFTNPTPMTGTTDHYSLSFTALASSGFVAASPGTSGSSWSTMPVATLDSINAVNVTSALTYIYDTTGYTYDTTYTYDSIPVYTTITHYWDSIIAHSIPIDVYAMVCSKDHYSYAYNGKYKDNEWAGLGNHYDYGERMYDPRITRFISRDPLWKENAGFSSYLYAYNSPLAMVDNKGRHGEIVINKGNLHSSDPAMSRTTVTATQIIFASYKRSPEFSVDYFKPKGPGDISQSKGGWNGTFKLPNYDVTFNTQFSAPISNETEFKAKLTENPVANILVSTNKINESGGNYMFLNPQKPEGTIGNSLSHEVGHLWGLLDYDGISNAYGTPSIMAYKFGREVGEQDINLVIDPAIQLANECMNQKVIIHVFANQDACGNISSNLTTYKIYDPVTKTYTKSITVDNSPKVAEAATSKNSSSESQTNSDNCVDRCKDDCEDNNNKN